MNPQGVRKPAWFAYKYLNALGEQELEGGDEQTIITRDERGVQVLTWTYEPPRDQNISNRPYFRQVRPSPPAPPLVLRFRGMAPGEHAVAVRRVGFRHNDAYTAWLEMGLPQTLDEDQVAQLHALTADQPEVMPMTIGADGEGSLTLPMDVHDVVLVEIEALRAP